MTEPDHPISLLMYGTLAIALLIAVILLWRYFSRNPAHPMRDQPERNIDEIREDAGRPD